MSKESLLGKKGAAEKDMLQIVKENFLPGITVALVSVPLSTALAMAAGASPMMGLITGIYGPGVQGIIGGSHYNILGPAGALVNVLKTYSATYGEQIIPWLAIGCGALSLLVYATGMERYATVLPLSVLEGFSCAVGLTIGLSQLNFALGLDKEKLKMETHPELYMNVYESLSNLENLEWTEFAPFLVLFTVLMVLSKYLPGRPWIILIAIVGVAYGAVTDRWFNESDPLKGSDIKPKLLRDLYPALTNDITLWQFEYWKGNGKAEGTFGIPISAIVVGSLKVSFVAVLETLISARIADNLTGTRFNQSQECFGMGIANVACGVLGGTPCTGVLVRTAVNVSSGGTHKASQFINAVVVLTMVLVLMPVFAYIPMAAIAAILITSSCRLIPKKIMAQYWTLDKANLGILIFTCAACIFIDGAMGLLIGAMVCLLRNAVQQNEGQIEIHQEAYEDRIINTAIGLQGPFTYITSYHIEATISDNIAANDPQFVVISLEDVNQIDLDGLDALRNILKERKKRRMAVVEPTKPQDLQSQGMEEGEDVTTLQFYYDYFVKSKLYQELSAEGLVFSDATAAAQHIQSLGAVEDENAAEDTPAPAKVGNKIN